MTTDDRSVPGMMCATLVSGRRRSPDKPSRAQTEAAGCSSARSGAGDVIRISPFRTTESLRLQTSVVNGASIGLCAARARTHWTCGAQASPTVVRGSMRDHVAAVVLPTA